ncbi:tetratricopeptide repeat protein [Streptosporangium sp. NPDC000396]|uniref:tetratricopeptide repeat protein n=1 Tax=Streptosporangium sp. NPDC000396 TaxID=3366185 RepID=UPI00368945F5
MPEVETRPLDTARKLAEDGDLDGAAAIFADLAADTEEPDRAQAAVGLAVVLQERGDVAGARAAARTALATGHPEFAAQAACLLAQSFEREELLDQARAAWQAALGLGNPGYVPLAHMALARLATEQREAEEALRAALATADPQIASHAAQRLAELLLGEGEPGGAAEALLEALSVPDVEEVPRLRVLLGIAHLELACAEFTGAVEEGGDAETSALAIELLARTLPLRGRDEDAEHVWRYGLDSPDEDLAEEVRLRLNRGI